MSQTTTKDKKTTKSNVKNTVDELSSLFENLHYDAKTSSELLSLGLYNSFSKQVEEIIKHPLTATFESYKGLKAVNVMQINEITVKYLLSNKNIKNIYAATIEDRGLFYSIVFKDELPANTSFINGFLDRYENSVYYKHFPVVLQEIPHAILDGFNMELERNKNLNKIV